MQNIKNIRCSFNKDTQLQFTGLQNENQRCFTNHTTKYMVCVCVVRGIDDTLCHSLTGPWCTQREKIGNRRQWEHEVRMERGQKSEDDEGG